MYGTRLRCSVCFGIANNGHCGRTRNARKTMEPARKAFRQNLSLRTEPVNFPYLSENLWKINRFDCVSRMMVSFRPKNDLSTTRHMERDRLEQGSNRIPAVGKTIFHKNISTSFAILFTFFINLPVNARYNVKSH